ncbi:MAG: hypothetical protein JWM12_3181, partial [Ilumatobacteraceae bacterium]|nr:hypothetical protein [Ilumatobacteraceae bacterium]
RSARPGGGPRPERTDRPARRGPRFAAPPELPQRPKAKRLKPGRAHRSAVLADLPEEQRAVAERALQGGLPAVRQAVNEQNARLKSEGKPEIPAAGLLSMAEQLLPKLRVAEWLDRADAALHDLEELDLRDLRSVVAAAEDPTVARDESTRQVAAQLKEALASKQDKELSLWFADIEAAIGVGRIVRALKLSSQPPKAGVRFPAELAGKLAATTTSSLSVDALPDRWVAVLEAAAFSPIRSHVQPTDKPAQINDELLATVKRVGSLLPHIATLFGVEVVAGGQSPKPLRPARPAPAKKAAAKAPIPPPPASTPAADTPAADAAVADTPAAEVPATDASVTNETPTGSGPGHAEAVEPTDPNATVHEPVLVSTDADVATEAEEPQAEADAGSNTDAEPATVYPPVEASLDEADTGAIVDAADHASDEANAAIVEPAEQIDADATVHEPVVVSTDADVLTESEQAEQWPEDGDATEHVPAIVSLDADPAQDDTAEIDTSSLEVDDRTANEADAATAELVDLDAFTPDD